MHGYLPGTKNAATKSGDRVVGKTKPREKSIVVQSPSDISVSDESEWFPRAARVLLAPKPGLVLHLLTDCGERNGDRYASGDVKVPSFIVRQLLRTEHGEAWLNVLMDGSTVPWWAQRREIERDAMLFREAIGRRG